VQNERVFEIGSARNRVSAGQLSQFDLVRDLPDVPVLSETLLLMELMIRQRTVDLGEISKLVLSDLGAALQILRVAGGEVCSIEGLPTRIEDCISNLGLQVCLDAMSRRTMRGSSRHPEMIEAWTHARLVAEECRHLAYEGRCPVNPEEAYLVGLLHELGSLPAMLGWDRTMQRVGSPDMIGLRMAQAWSLPRCVAEYFAPLRSISGVNPWREVVQQAHKNLNISLVESIPQELTIRQKHTMGALAHAFSS
jgi:hypothetical protein